MAKTNKYVSINFNEIYAPRKPAAAPPPSAPLSAAARTHGRMLVLTRPSNPHPPPPPPPQKHPDPLPAVSEPDSISLRPLGRTDSCPAGDTRDKLAERETPPPALLTPSKPEPFVPPHLRPGFAGRQEKLGQERDKQGFRPRDRSFFNGNGHRREAPNGRPKSGGSCDGLNRSGSDLDRSLPASGGVGNRPGSSGGSYGASYGRPQY